MDEKDFYESDLVKQEKVKTLLNDPSHLDNLEKTRLMSTGNYLDFFKLF
jgi:hypothetical protein